MGSTATVQVMMTWPRERLLATTAKVVTVGQRKHKASLRVLDQAKVCP